jgi:hypothetical protein
MNDYSDALLAAYQKSMISLDEFRARMNALHAALSMTMDAALCARVVDCGDFRLQIIPVFGEQG